MTSVEAKLRSQNSEPARDEPAVRAFKAFIRRKSYPCLGAKSALSRGRLTCFCGHDITQPNDDEHIADKVQSLALDTHHDDVFVSLAVLFPGSPMLSEIAFEQALWQRLRAINAIDRLQHGWDSSVSDDPQSRHFSMSVGGKGFFVVGLHPGASRLARRFQCPAMVFNLHSQFDRLRAEGRYEKLRGAIGERDVAFSGSRNPMLAAFGQRSEARQYSGRCLDEDWECPFMPNPEEGVE